MVDPARLRRSFDRVAAHGDEVPLYFYSSLFLRYPETRQMFPPSMAAQRDRLVSALGTIVSEVDNLDALIPFAEELGRDHRKFGVIGEHYPAVGVALLATLEHFLGEEWTDELAAAWTEAYGIISSVMQKAAEEDAELTPPWWEAEIVAHERRSADLAVITVRVDGRLDYLPGQSISVQTGLRPRLWRYYSPANVPRPDALIEFHVRAQDGGWVSSALVHSAGIGDALTLGPPVGQLVLDRHSDRDIVLLAGGTGLAPLRAMVDQMAREPGWSRRVHLFVGGRREQDLYDLPTLQRVTVGRPWLNVVPVVEHGPVAHSQLGTPAEVAVRMGRWSDHDVYICGSDPMVASSREVLIRAGVPAERLRHEGFGYRTTRADGPAPAPDGQAPGVEVAPGAATGRGIEAGRGVVTGRGDLNSPTPPAGVLVSGGE